MSEQSLEFPELFSLAVSTSSYPLRTNSSLVALAQAQESVRRLASQTLRHKVYKIHALEATDSCFIPR